jgi:hypothetical protein
MSAWKPHQLLVLDFNAVNDSGIDTQTPMTIGQQMNNGEKNEKKTQKSKAQQNISRAAHPY